MKQPFRNLFFWRKIVKGFKNDRTYWATTIAILNSGSSNILQWPLFFFWHHHYFCLQFLWVIHRFLSSLRWLLKENEHGPSNVFHWTVANSSYFLPVAITADLHIPALQLPISAQEGPNPFHFTLKNIFFCWPRRRKTRLIEPRCLLCSWLGSQTCSCVSQLSLDCVTDSGCIKHLGTFLVFLCVPSKHDHSWH